MSSSDNPAFEDAIQRFLDSLSEEERGRYSPCASADDLLDGLRKLEVVAKQRSARRSSRFLAGVKALNDRLQPYFEVIGLFIQSNPTYAAIVWGALRLVLQLASNFTNFFEKLVKVLQHLADAFPQYGQFASLCKDSASSRMKSHLESVYIDLFEFFQGVARVFTNSTGKLRKTNVIIGDLMWRPFDARFQDLLERMAYHRELVQGELTLIQAQATHDAEKAAVQERALAAAERSHAEEARKKALVASSCTVEMKRLVEEEHRDKILHQIRSWLSPPEFSEVLQKSQELREDGTNYWIFELCRFKDWRRSEWAIKPASNVKKLGTNALWIHGNPGCGKTVLASSVIAEFQADPDIDTQPASICYFFFKSEDPLNSTTAAACSSILTQILHQHRRNDDLIDRFAFAMRESSAGMCKATSQELRDLVHLCLLKLGQTYLILDGIDECNDNSYLIKHIHQLTSSTTTKILLFSRRNIASLTRTVLKAQQLAVDRSSMSHDIGMFLTSQIRLLIEDDILPATVDVSDLVKHLVKGADGMFLWARLMIKYLQSPALTQALRLATIKQVILPEGLDEMYERILELISRAGRSERDFARRILMWLTYSMRPLTVRQLHEAVTVNNMTTTDPSSHMFKDFLETITLVCGSLVECASFNNPEDPNVHFIHLSLKEYLMQIGRPDRSNKAVQSLIPAKPIASLDLASYCLQYLISHTPAQRLSGLPDFACALNRSRDIIASFAGYAASNWMDHLKDTIAWDCSPVQLSLPDFTTGSSRLIDTCFTFLDSPRSITSWLETYYLTIACGFQEWDKKLTFRHVEEWADWTAQLPCSMPVAKAYADLAPKFREFSSDMEALIEAWGQKLRVSPSILWDEASAFTNSRFLVPSIATNVVSLVPETLRNGKSSLQPLCTISHTSADESINGVLSIWPSSSFERHWQQLEISSSYLAMKEFCSGWTAKYDVWSVKTKTVQLFDIRIPLDEAEIWLQMRQSFRQEYQDNWKTSFPLTISDDAHAFVVLRTLFVLRPATQSTPASIKSTVIPMDFEQSLESVWTDKLQVFNPHAEKIKDLPPALQLFHRCCYLYSTRFSPNGRYIFFWDRKKHLLTTSLAVFEISASDVLRVKLKGEGGLFSSCQDNLDTKVAFHPEAEFLVLWYRCRLTLWHFKRPFEEAIDLDTAGDPINLRLRSINISRCGRFVVLTFHERSTPSIVPIPEQYLQIRQSPQTSAYAGAPELTEDDGKELTQLGCMDISAFNLSPGQSLRGNRIVVAENGEPQSLMTVENDGTVKVKIMNAGSQVCQSLEIVSLPQWPGLPDAAATVKLPSSGNGAVKMIMDKTAQQGYSLSEPNVERLPFVVERDPRALQHTISENRSIEGTFRLPVEASVPLRGLDTAPSAQKVVGLEDGEETRAFDASKAAMLAEQGPRKRLRLI